MVRSTWYILVAAILVASCTSKLSVQKRKYTGGFYFSYVKKKHIESSRDKNTLCRSAKKTTEVTKSITDPTESFDQAASKVTEAISKVSEESNQKKTRTLQPGKESLSKKTSSQKITGKSKVLGLNKAKSKKKYGDEFVNGTAYSVGSVLLTLVFLYFILTQIFDVVISFEILCLSLTVILVIIFFVVLGILLSTKNDS